MRWNDLARTTIKLRGYLELEVAGSSMMPTLCAGETVRIEALQSAEPGMLDAQVCACCARWTRSPEDLAVGACWAEPAESVPVTRTDTPCGKDMFEQGMSLEQNLMRMTA